MKKIKKLIVNSAYIFSLIVMLSYNSISYADSFSAGDANYDCKFDSSDLIQIFGYGKYESNQIASWDQGDFNSDGNFNSSDLIAALSTGNYEAGLTCDVCFAWSDRAVGSCSSLQSNPNQINFENCITHTSNTLSKCTDFDSIAAACTASSFTLDYALSTPSMADDGRAVSLTFLCISRML